MTPGRWILWLLVLPIALAMWMIFVIGLLERLNNHQWLPAWLMLLFGCLGVLATLLTVVATLLDIRASGERAHPLSSSRPV